MFNGFLRNRFWQVELAFWVWYSLGRKYRLSSKERPRVNFGEGINYTYGETPLAVLSTVFEHISPEPGTSFLELGSGTGRLSFAAAMLYGLHASGIEAIPTFVRRANRLRQWLGLKEVDFRQGDFFEESWSEADIVYVTATTFTQPTLLKLDRKLSELRDGAWFICLTHSPKSADIAIEHRIVVDCSWGAATVFICRKLPCALS